MKINTKREQLIHAVSLAERITGKKESLPVLSCVLFEAREKNLVLRATNLEAGIEITIPANIEQEGIVALPVGVVSQTIRSMNSDSITLKESDGNLSIESKNSKNLIKAVPHEEFPSLIGKLKSGGSSISRTNLLSAIQSVLYAASPSMIRPELGSIFVALEGGVLTTVATDSFRLAEKKTSTSNKKDSKELLIPLKHANELVYILERVDGEDVEIITDEAQCVVLADGVRFISRLVEGQFPNYQEIIPKTFTTEATLLKNDLIETLRKARVFSGNDQQVGLHIYPKRKIFSAIARSADVGEMSDDIDAAISGEDLDINFHIGYLADCLPSIQSDSVTLQFAGAGKPLVVRGVSDASFRYLVMPLNR